MNLYPAIDIYEGQAVRLTRGDYAKKTVYFDAPEEAAEKWAEQGAQWIHLVDLEGAKAGHICNFKSLEAIRKKVTAKLELGGGIRTLEGIERILNLGINRVILGTKALDATFLEKALTKYGDKIAVGLDVRDGKVQTQGWLEDGGQELDDAIEMLNSYEIGTIIYTDIKKDGMLQGPNFASLEHVLGISKSNIILSGGVATLDDIRQCTKLTHSNFDGAIVGKAIYEDKFTVAEALKIINEKAEAAGG